MGLIRKQKQKKVLQDQVGEQNVVVKSAFETNMHPFREPLTKSASKPQYLIRVEKYHDYYIKSTVKLYENPNTSGTLSPLDLVQDKKNIGG